MCSKSVQETHRLLKLRTWPLTGFFLCLFSHPHFLVRLLPVSFVLPYSSVPAVCALPPPPSPHPGKSTRGRCGSSCRHLVSRAFMVTPLCCCNPNNVAAVCEICLTAHFVPWKSAVIFQDTYLVWGFVSLLTVLFLWCADFVAHVHMYRHDCSCFQKRII